MTLRECRTSLVLTQNDVARALDVDQSAVSGWESGRTRMVSKHRRKLCELYACTPEELAQMESETRATADGGK